MADKHLPAPDVLRKVLAYDAETGVLVWKERKPAMFSDAGHSAEHSCRTFNSRYAGKPAFTAKNKHGYFTGGIFRKVYLAHRVVWALATGSWPKGEIDHINGDRTDNRLLNLREVDDLGNSRNAKRRADNASGATGVYFYKPTGKWQVNIGVSGKSRYLGRYDTIEEAIKVRREAEIAECFHANHGREG